MASGAFVVDHDPPSSGKDGGSLEGWQVVRKCTDRGSKLESNHV
jgi:hypothetical protein